MVLATGCMFIQNDILIMAVVITLAVVFLLVIYALTTKTDFTGCGPYLFCTLSILVICGIFGLTRWLDPNVYAYIDRDGRTIIPFQPMTGEERKDLRRKAEEIVKMRSQV